MKISKQIIVMRKSFIIDGKTVTPRKGKYIAQGSHAVLKAIFDKMNMHPTEEPGIHEMTLYLEDGSALMDWIEGSFTKICCAVETEAELLEVYNKAKEKGLICSLITDHGHTEFNNIPTITCCAIGPAWSDELDEITGHLKLF